LDEKRRILVGNFLKKFKKIATKGRGIDIIPRRKTLDSLSKLGITKHICKEEILSLSVDDYCKGPKPDEDRPGEVWEFGKTILGKEVYIKLKIARAGRAMIAKCLSFHEAVYPLCFPFKGDAEKGGGMRNERNLPKL